MQPINGENINGLISDYKRPDTRARRVWRNVFFDIRVTNTCTNSQIHLSPKKVLERLEVLVKNVLGSTNIWPIRWPKIWRKI